MKKKRNKFKKYMIVFVITLVMFPVFYISLKSSQSSVNIEVEQLKKEIIKETNKIECLSMKADELKSLANISDAIESEGLGYNSTNIKVLSKN